MARIIDIAVEEDMALAEGSALLLAGELVAMPTETVYGLAADATNPQAIAKIYAAKGRPAFNPLICHMSGLEMAEDYAVFSPLARTLAQAFWPGPLTLVLPLKQGAAIAPAATANLPTIGVRVPQGFAGRLIAETGRPLAAPSANTSGRISPTTAAHVEADLGEKLRLILDAGPAEVGVESTILKVEDETITLLRPGGISAAEVEALTDRRVARLQQKTAIVAPGMMVSHYAPKAAVRLDATRVEDGEALVLFGPCQVENASAAHATFQLSAKGDLAEAASRLYDTMIEADLSGATAIVFAPIPKEGIGEAINDRLSRAAAPRKDD
ncbi:threonylcarbamoyl-AMP synthase [Martelella lutilitoris]|uniref:Threonylcarbamoyl-AMP synthase n=1 Tax=Martelella lutilitoris TaxID=2583532 RepID=A0A5C4JTN7_9HYPH|nr:L-threonylcarbamoyladenylate synthase [Martelella lutilitoris]TNB48622.1 threonylcarbamoyl-AMP synthase [Martelella lutilitoris]